MQPNNILIEDDFYNKIYEKIDFSKEKFKVGEYENCKFISCNFSNADLSNIVFSECTFDGCNLSMTLLNKSSLKDVEFLNSKILGIKFNSCKDFMFEVYFENSNLKLSSFYFMKLIKTKFKNCEINEVDFSGTDLTNSIFEKCDLKRSIFNNTILEKADFRTSFNYCIDPEINKIKKAKFSLSGLPGLLEKYNIEIS